MCLSTLLFNGCMLTMPEMLKPAKPASADIEEDKPEEDKPSVIEDKVTTDITVAEQDIPFVNVKEPENKLPVALNGEQLSKGSTISVEKIIGDEELKVLKKVKNLESKLREEEDERKKTDALVEELNKQISTRQAAAAAKRGAGYLEGGSTIGLGIIDGDDELRVLKKVKRLEARLAEEQNKVELLNEELAALQSAKETVDNDLESIKNLLKEESARLLKNISTLESTLEETKSRAIAAEERLQPIKKELLKVQISETRAQQELYKLKIEKIKEDEE